MLSTLVLLAAVSQLPPQPSVEYSPWPNRVSWQIGHYKHTSPLNGRTVLSPSPSDEYFSRRRWSQLTPAQQMRPEYRDLRLAAASIADPIVYLRFVAVGVQLVPGDPIDESLTDSRLGDIGR